MRFMIKPVTGGGSDEKQDQRLPRADTCFFNFELPRYTTLEVMRRQILFAINFDNVSLNAEREDRQNDNMSGRSRGSLQIIRP